MRCGWLPAVVWLRRCPSSHRCGQHVAELSGQPATVRGCLLPRLQPTYRRRGSSPPGSSPHAHTPMTNLMMMAMTPRYNPRTHMHVAARSSNDHACSLACWVITTRAAPLGLAAASHLARLLMRRCFPLCSHSFRPTSRGCGSSWRAARPRRRTPRSGCTTTSKSTTSMRRCAVRSAPAFGICRSANCSSRHSCPCITDPVHAAARLHSWLDYGNLGWRSSRQASAGMFSDC